MERNLAMARRIARIAEKAGGRVYFVGGFVRDSVMGRESKDVDIEIHGMTADAVRKMLGEIGPWKEMGASFGVFALRGYTLDIALPRRGGGKGEDADIDPFMGVEEAARRRDFTMNAGRADRSADRPIRRAGGHPKSGDSACGRENLPARPAESHPGGAVRGAARVCDCAGNDGALPDARP